MTQKDKDRYLAAAHAMQSGVAMELNFKPEAPKYLRVGINSAMSNHGALATLLIAKGIFTEDEYMKALADAMEQEKDTYEELLSKHFGQKITLV